MIHLNIGSNLNSNFGNRFVNISIAIKLLIKEKFIIKKISNFYTTPSYPNKRLPNFLNIGLIGTFSRRVEELRNIIAVIERKIGRVKTKKNDPRVCDIDIIDFNGKTLSIGDLTIPHKKCHQRNFVLFPISQIDPRWEHPVFRKNVNILIGELDLKSRIEITRLNKNVNINS